ncbi:MAG: guanylate kinase [Desulfobacteraceae bacterium]
MTTKSSGPCLPHKKDKRSAGVRTGHLFIVSAPSGAGKTTLCNAVRQQFSTLAYSVSYTTRQPRPGERQGRDYHFISVDEFELGISQGRWAEWAKVHDNYYGTSAQWIDRTLNAGRDILLDIDMQGARQMTQRFAQAITVFIMPPSMEVLEKRLRARGADNPETIALRLVNAEEEIAQKGFCKHLIVNDDLEEALHRLGALIKRYLGPKL